MKKPPKRAARKGVMTMQESPKPVDIQFDASGMLLDGVNVPWVTDFFLTAKTDSSVATLRVILEIPVRKNTLSLAGASFETVSGSMLGHVSPIREPVDNFIT
jgi:hypothetical protein